MHDLETIKRMNDDTFITKQLIRAEFVKGVISDLTCKYGNLNKPEIKALVQELLTML